MKMALVQVEEEEGKGKGKEVNNESLVSYILLLSKCVFLNLLDLKTNTYSVRARSESPFRCKSL